MFITDSYNHRIRKVTVSTGSITSIAGNGTASYSGDNGAATSAGLYRPFGIAVDDSSGIIIITTVIPLYFQLLFHAFRY